jgi:hypothetical protein
MCISGFISCKTTPRQEIIHKMLSPPKAEGPPAQMGHFGPTPNNLAGNFYSVQLNCNTCALHHNVCSVGTAAGVCVALGQQ